jgi:hypothetical protein
MLARVLEQLDLLDAPGELSGRLEIPLQRPQVPIHDVDLERSRRRPAASELRGRNHRTSQHVGLG